jgi:Tol biopolymer transport system component
MRDGTLFIVTLVTSGWDSLGVYGEQGQYSPTGDRIAYIQVRPGLEGPLWVMNSDGSAPPRQLTSDSRLYGQYSGFGWSPDGRFLIARGPDNLELIRVADGLILPLPLIATAVSAHAQAVRG